MAVPALLLGPYRNAIEPTGDHNQRAYVNDNALDIY
jgi:hypothetical protein